jgi:DNA-binding response OmpR family regulator
VVRDLRIDPAARKAWRGVNEVALTTREFDVLEFMMRRAGRLLSKTDILNGVWDADFDGDPNIVEAYVHRLRRKLDVQSELPAITTVRGAGYRFESD